MKTKKHTSRKTHFNIQFNGNGCICKTLGAYNRSKDKRLYRSELVY